MSKLVLVARILLGLIFFVFGLNGFLNFLPAPELNEPSGALLGALVDAGLMNVVKTIEILGGAMLLAGLFVPLALTILAPIVINIFYFHTVLDPGGLPIAVVVLVLNVFLAWGYRGAFAGVLDSRAAPTV